MTEDTYADWDGAYVLGALSPAERREYERHLAGCVQCSTAVGELAGVPGLLATVGVEDVVDPARRHDAAGTDAPDSLLPQLITRVRRNALRRRIMLATTLAAAACVAALALLVARDSDGPSPVARSQVSTSTVPSPSSSPAPSTSESGSGAERAEFALQAVTPGPLKAGVRLVTRPWGTEIQLTCSYAEDYPTERPTPGEPVMSYAMIVTDRAGNQTQVATWNAGPGTTTEPTASTSLWIQQIASIEVESTPGVVLLRGTR